MKLLADNYQCLDNVEIDLQGLTGIVGDNDTGKSSLVRAVYGLATNQSGDDFVQDGEPETKVKIEAEDSTRILWKKKRTGSGTYIIDGEKYTKTGRGYFDKLFDYGIAPIEAGPDTIDLQFFLQNEPFFILKKPSTRKFEILSHVFDSEKYTNALSDMRDDIREVKGDIKDNRAVKDNVEEQLEEVEERKDKAKPVVESIEEKAEILKDKAETFERVKDLSRSAEDTKEKLQKTERVIAQAKESMEAVVDSKTRLQELIEHHSQLAEAKEVKDKANTLADKEKSAKASLSSMQGIVKTISGKVAEYTEIKELKDKFEDKSSRLESIEDKLSEAGALESLRDRVDVLSEKIDRLNEMQGLLNNYQEVNNSLEELGDRADEIEQELKEAEQELKDKKEELGKCPLCGSSF